MLNMIYEYVVAAFVFVACWIAAVVMGKPE